MGESDGPRRLHVFFSGTVQGVGFRSTVQRCAERFSVTGSVRNRSDGRVELVAEGKEAELEKFLEKICDSMDGYITEKQRLWEPATGEYQHFQIQPTH